MRIISIWVLVLFISCNTSQQPTQHEDENAGHLEESKTAEEQFVLNTTTPFYVHLEGAIGDYPINMELSYFPNRYESGPGYQGYYYYQKYGEPIAFYGSEDEAGLISLTESDVQGNETGNFKGRLDKQGLFQGKWISGDQKRTLPFELKPSGSSILSFDLSLFSDSLLIPTGAEEAPRVIVDQRWLYPKAGGDKELIHFLQTEVRKAMVGDSLAAIYGNPKSAFDIDKKRYFEEYQAEVGSLIEYQQKNPDEESWIMNYDFSRDMEIYFLSPTLLTMRITDYSFTGGAHGNYGTSSYVYDLQEKKLIDLEAIFKPGYENKLSQILAAKAREAYGLKPSQPLSDIFFQDDIGPTENFGLTDKGILFVYNPYEIAAYVFGQVELFVAFDEISEWVK